VRENTTRKSSYQTGTAIMAEVGRGVYREFIVLRVSSEDVRRSFESDDSYTSAVI